jgi:hypothetical protein
MRARGEAAALWGEEVAVGSRNLLRGAHVARSVSMVGDADAGSMVGDADAGRRAARGLSAADRVMFVSVGVWGCGDAGGTCTGHVGSGWRGEATNSHGRTHTHTRIHAHTPHTHTEQVFSYCIHHICILLGHPILGRCGLSRDWTWRLAIRAVGRRAAS